MELVNLGRAGVKVSRICLGCMTYGSSRWRPWVLDEEASRPFFRRAWEAGVNFFDTADMYSDGASEEVLGRALRELAIPRERVVVATKVFNPTGPSVNERGLSRKHIAHAIDASLRRLGLDYVDLYQIHRFDPKTPIEEALEALDAVVRAGKALYIGASSMYAWQMAKMLHTSDRLGLARFVTMQNHYNLVYREEEREMIPLCRDEGVGLIPWSPLARGFLAGNRRRDDRGATDQGETSRARTDDFAHKMYYDDGDFAVVDRVGEIARARGVSHAQVALAWLLHQPGVTAPIIGASKPHHLDDALAALKLKLDATELKALAEPYRPHPVLGHH
jgi:aryl-alcohol dehydrogenase (NADP+)